MPHPELAPRTRAKLQLCLTGHTCLPGATINYLERAGLVTSAPAPAPLLAWRRYTATIAGQTALR